MIQIRYPPFPSVLMLSWWRKKLGVSGLTARERDIRPTDRETETDRRRDYYVNILRFVDF